ncbi:shikimate 5-dehydrogenase [Nocardioides sp. GY 10127]|uniref:shikimate 5-dehydrogenase n=1 Tax=Nocardioides sp. GY 10127 TaxID=2569762 RepID=UPI0010A89AD9|nr:shikimate 5-dehydrogenase [Nocardioides sp. GY 10127]TIC85714.1 shikimate 5-dehydrogenase [Nocardioides sp. GY 10127]
MPILHRDMTLCISLSGRPSNIGTRFHNYLYDELDLPFVYKAFSTDDLEGAIRGVRALGIGGVSVSMPFKTDVMAFVDEVEESAAAIDAVNTVVNTGGRLVASNTDYEAVQSLVASHGLDTSAPVLLRGSGGMAKAVAAALQGSGYEDVTVVARNREAGPALAERYGFRWLPDVPENPVEGALLVNVTPLGMDGPQAEELAFDHRHLHVASGVMDVVAFPSETPLVRAARDAGLPVVTGAEVIALQAARQFARYTGVTPTDEQVARASAFSRE